MIMVRPATVAKSIVLSDLEKMIGEMLFLTESSVFPCSEFRVCVGLLWMILTMYIFSIGVHCGSN